MNQIKLIIFLALLLGAPSLAQGVDVKEAERLAQTLSQQADLPVNVRLRFSLLDDMLKGLLGKADPANTLSFFSTTRILAWNQPVSPLTAEALRDFEAQMVLLARSKNFNLDLPPVGYSTVGATGAPVPVAGGPNSGPLLTDRSTREGLQLLTLRAEEMGTNALSASPSPELQTLRDSLTVLRQDLADSQISSDAVRNVLLARAVYLASPVSANVDAAQNRGR